MKEFLKKLTSRKLLTAIGGMISGLLILFGVDAGVAGVLAGSAVIIISAVTYIIVEGKLDAQAIIEALNKTKDVIEDISEEPKQ